MAEWKKANTAWFGDTFNRDAMLCSAEIAVDKASSDDCCVKGVSLSNSGDTLSWSTANTCVDGNALNELVGYASCVKADTSHSTMAIAADIECIQDQLSLLQQKIEELEKRQTVTSNLRSALKTLQYKREVE